MVIKLIDFREAVPFQTKPFHSVGMSCPPSIGPGIPLTVVIVPIVPTMSDNIKAPATQQHYPTRSPSHTMNSIPVDTDLIAAAFGSMMLVPQIVSIICVKDVSGLAAPTIYLNVAASACSTVYNMHQGQIGSTSMALFMQNIVIMRGRIASLTLQSVPSGP